MAGIHCIDGRGCYDDLVNEVVNLPSTTIAPVVVHVPIKKTPDKRIVGLSLGKDSPTDISATDASWSMAVRSDAMDQQTVSVEFHCKESTKYKQVTNPDDTVITLTCNKNDHSGIAVHSGD